MWKSYTSQKIKNLLDFINMNGTEESKTGFLQSGNYTTPLLPATDMEEPPPLPSDHHHADQHDTHITVVTEHKPGVAIDKAFDFTGHVDCTFEKVFPEAKGSQSLQPVLQCMNQAFSMTQKVIYMLLTVFIGTFLVVIWAVLFALFNFLIVWILQPYLKLTFMFLRLGGELSRVFMRSCMQPFFQAVSLVYSNFKGNFNVNVAAQDLSTDDLPSQAV